MKKFEVFFSSLFVIGLIGVLSLYLLTDKPTENYLAASLISVIAMLPKILLTFFEFPGKLTEMTIGGLLKFYIIYMVFVILQVWIFPHNTSNLFFSPWICPAMTVIVFIWGWIYYRRHRVPKSELLNIMVDSIKELHDIDNVEDQFNFEGLLLLPGSEKEFVVKEKFKLNQVKYEGVPRIGYIGPNFQKHFLDMVEPGQPKRSLNQYKPVKLSKFKKVLSFIQTGDHFVYLQDIWETLILHERGYRLPDNNCILIANGMFNVFPVKKPINEIWFIIVAVETANNTWEIEAYQELESLNEKENVFSQN